MLPSARDGWLLGVDTSQFQGVLDVPALAAAGVGFLVARATYGSSGWVDPRWTATAEACVAEELPFGGYGVLVPNQDPAAQARRWVAQVRDSGATIPGWCDFELAAHETAIAALLACAVWCDEAEAGLGRRVFVYASPSFIEGLEQLAGKAAEPVLARLVPRPLVVADYGSGRRVLDPTKDSPRVPPPFPRVTVWQVGPFGETLPRTGTAVDIDWFQGTVDELVALGELPAAA